MTHPATGPPDPLDYLFSLEVFGIKFGLANIRSLCDGLDRPQDSFRSILIAGTNGKGSVTAFVERGLRAAGHRTGRYTSPHLTSLSERFVIDGEPVAEPLLRETAAAVRAVVERLLGDRVLTAHPTFFEVTTAIAFELFRRLGVEVAVVEVGLGGRLDSTNILEPLLTAITTIDLDHQEQLGDSLTSIAFEKAGIIKEGVPLVIGRLTDEAARVIEAVAEERHAPVVRAMDEVQVDRGSGDASTNLTVSTRRATYGPLDLSLRGRHQIDNALVAVRLLEEADDAGLTAGPAAIHAALTDTRWPGRLDLRTGGQGRSLLLDAAHNPAGAGQLAAYLREVYPEKIPLVFAAMRDKDSREMLAALMPCVTRVILTRAPTRRAADPSELAEAAASLGTGVPITVEPDIPRALELAWASGARTVCVAGSIFLVGAVLEVWK